ncbi:MAG: EamA family transporter [Dehalococcoidales bacterium]
MNWASVAILSTATFAVVNTLDSHLLSKRMPGLRAFLLPVGIFHFAYALLSFYLIPLPEGVSVLPILVAVASGIFRTAAITLILYNLRREEVSRVIPVVYTYPIFVAIIAVPLLGETLTYLHWLAIIIVVAGAVMISIRQGSTGTTIWLGKPLILLFGSSLLLALADITSKYALTYISFWNMFSLTAFCISGIFLLVSVRPHILSQLGNLKQKSSTIVLIILDEIFAPTGSVLLFWALERGLVSLVSTIASSRPIFVVVFALILSRVLPGFLEWQPGKGMLVLRFVATAMIVGGVAIIYLT